MIRAAPAVVGNLSRRGTVLPFLALTITVLVGFLALAIDIGHAGQSPRRRPSNAADLAALTASRTLNGVRTRQL